MEGENIQKPSSKGMSSTGMVLGIVVLIAILGAGYFFFVDRDHDAAMMEDPNGAMMEEDSMKEKEGDAMMKEEGGAMMEGEIKVEGEAMMEKEN